VSDGHPWVFSEALRGRILGPDSVGSAVDLVDPEGRFVARALADPQQSLVLRVFSSDPQARFDSEYLRRTVRRCQQRRQSLPGDCHRLVNGDSEGIPAVTVDRYGPYLVLCYYSTLVETFHTTLIEALVQVARPTGIYLQRRHAPPTPGQPRPGAELVHGLAAPPGLAVVEGRCRYVVDVSAPASPGLFLDMRNGRAAVARLSGGRRVLNCFSYTGTFSVVAARHGAAVVVSVDSSARAHGRARRNFEENRIELQDPSYEFITGDAFATLARLLDHKRRFDLVILDPPTYSSAKGRTFAAPKDYADLVRAALEVIEPGGVLLACCNAAKLTASDLDRAVGRGAALASRRVVITERLGLPPDFPVLPVFIEGDYLKLLVGQVD